MTSSITVDIRGTLVRQGLQNLAGELPEIGRLRIYRAAQSIQTSMKVEGKKPTYPIQWDSEKQRRAFFASKGFGGGIPHVRTKTYIRAWTLTKLGEIGYRVANASKGAEAIAGDALGRQSKIHVGRWPAFRPVIDKELSMLPSMIQKDIQVAIQKQGLS